MTDKVLVMAKKDVSVSQFDALEGDAAVKQIRGTGNYLVILARPDFMTDIRHLDVDKTFSILYDQPVMLDSLSDEESEEIAKRFEAEGQGRGVLHLGE